MRYSLAALTALAIPALTSAQYGAPPGPVGGSSSSSTSAAPTAPTAPPSTQGFVNIDVAFQGNFVFNPANVSAPNGTIVTFFFPNAGLNHTVTQSSFNDPCTPLAANSSTGAPAGFDSEFVAGVQWSINVTNDQIPIWFHCKMPMHCGLGMVGSINAPTSGPNTFDNFKAKAMAIGSNEPTESTGSVLLTGDGAFAAVAPTNTASVSGGSSGGSGSGAVTVVASSITVLMGVALSMVFLA